MRLRVVTAMVITLSAIACQQSTGADALPAGLTRVEFLKVIEDLQSAQPSERAAIFTKHRTTEAEIRAYVTALSTDPIALSQVLDTIQVRMDRERFVDPKKFAPLPEK